MSETSKVRLLIVDDETALMQALCNILQQQGYETTGCTSAEQAMLQLQAARFDLLLTDLMMPDTDGLALARAALARDPTLVVVMMTGEGSIVTAVEAMQSGVLDYVLKPFKLGTMLPVLERALAVGRLRRENAALQERLLDRTAELEIANRELEAYASTVSHDLRAPLHGIDGLTRLLAQRLQGFPTQETTKLLDLIGASVQRAQRLIDDLLRLSRIGRQPLLRRAVDVSLLAQEVAAALQAESPAPGTEIVVAPGLPRALADPALLRQVFVNLIGNALKFTRRRATARIEVGGYGASGESVYFVGDDGPGFDMALAGKLFMPFERLQGAESYEGSGVGLSIVQRIVQRHGGRIWVRAGLGQGAHFFFTLAEPPAPDGAAV
jgi:signal transduction histidine kinase